MVLRATRVLSLLPCLLVHTRWGVSGFVPLSATSPIRLKMSSASSNSPHGQFDVLLYGATGFTGKLVSAYLDKAPELQGPGRSWAIAGRSEDRLQDVREGLQTNPPAIVPCDLADTESTEEMVSKARVVINCAGPFSTQNGDNLLGACARQGRHYSDLSGETFWQREMVVAHHDIAASTGAKIVLGGGVDSIPSDLGVYLALKELQPREGEDVQITGVYTEYTGSFSGGTLASGEAIKAAVKQGRLPIKLLRDPYILAPGVKGADSKIGTHSGFARGWKREFSWSFGMLLDFFMAGINATVVRRSLALRGLAQTVSYRECASVGFVLRLLWTLLLRGFGYFAGEPVNWKPKPGQGPPAWLVECGGYTVHVTATSSRGSECSTAVVRGRGDPGYGATSKMLAEVALCLAFDAEKLRALPELPAGGVLTPSTAMGDVLVERLASAQGGRVMALSASRSERR